VTAKKTRLAGNRAKSSSGRNIITFIPMLASRYKARVNSPNIFPFSNFAAWARASTNRGGAFLNVCAKSGHSDYIAKSPLRPGRISGQNARIYNSPHYYCD
jgi:hypothetical protein